MAPLINLVLGFVVVMAGVSLVVSILVALVLRLDNRRSRQLAEMLAAANYGFRKHHGDRGTADDEAAAAFVEDILADVALRCEPALVAAPSSIDAGKRDPIEYIAIDDLIAIIGRLSPAGRLPDSWHKSLSPQLATPRKFAEWLSLWFPTVEANATERFRRETQRFVAVVSAIAVVLLNLDAIQLCSDLFDQSALAGALADHAQGLEQLSQDARARTEPPPPQEVLGDLVQINSMLNVPELKLGWQRSTFIERFCTWRGNCALPPSLTQREFPPGNTDFAFYALRWFAGLTCSALLLALGAPFWSDRLRTLLRLRNAVEQKKAQVSSRQDGSA